MSSSSLHLRLLPSGHLVTIEETCKSHSWFDVPVEHLKLDPLLPHPGGWAPICKDLSANSFITFPVDAGEAHWIFPLGFPRPGIFQILQNGKQKQTNKKPSTVVLSSLIADNFIRCQEKQKKMQTQNNNLTVIFGVRKWETQQAAGEGSLNTGVCERQQ